MASCLSIMIHISFLPTVSSTGWSHGCLMVGCNIHNQWSHDSQWWCFTPTWIFPPWHQITRFLTCLEVVYLPGRNGTDNREQHNGCWLKVWPDYSWGIVIVNLKGIALPLAITGECADYRLQSPMDCPDLMWDNEQRAAEDTRNIKLTPFIFSYKGHFLL